MQDWIDEKFDYVEEILHLQKVAEVLTNWKLRSDIRAVLISAGLLVTCVRSWNLQWELWGQKW
jgi:hypothetical protein